MVMKEPSSRLRGAALVTIELVIAIGLLASAMLPLAYAIVQEQRFARACFYRALAIEIVDGEMEVLRAGEWRVFSEGRHTYKVLAESAAALPPGQFVLTINRTEARLEWRPSKKNQGGPVARAFPLRTEKAGHE